jgi:DNA-binding GntR family transcriptional regulator
MVLQETTPILRKSLKNEVFDILHGRILAGECLPGEWLRQDDISSQLGISMTPVREALDLLVSSGLAERIPYRGVRVLQPTPQEIVDSYALRLLLESSAVYLAALNISSPQISMLEKILEQSKSLVELKDMSKVRVLSRELHGSIVSSSGNALLHKMYLNVLNIFPDWMLYEYLFRHPEHLNKSMSSEYDEHLEIVRALTEHQPELAVKKTVEHITNRGRELEGFLGIPKEMVRTKEELVLPLLAHYMKNQSYKEIR